MAVAPSRRSPHGTRGFRTLTEVIEAAGGVVWRTTAKGRVKILVVHRPAYDDWSLPKGKLEPGERPLDAALREVREETGLRCRPGPALPEARYIDLRGRPKRVRYWAMTATGGRFASNDEVDAVRWIRVEDAAHVLSYRHDRAVVAGLLRLDVLAS